MELEIKLEMNCENAKAVFAWLNAPTPKSIAMETTYFCDCDSLLEQNKMMLRLRRENHTCLCTFKAPLADFDGAARLEIEVPAENISQGIASLLLDSRLPPIARHILQSSVITPCCGASFIRLQSSCRVQDTDFLLSWDEGHLFAGQNRANLSELELELVSGSFSLLSQLSLQIQQDFCGSISTKSKAQRAFALI